MDAYNYAKQETAMPSLEDALFMCGPSKDEMWELYSAMRAKQDGKKQKFQEHLSNLKGYCHV